MSPQDIREFKLTYEFDGKTYSAILAMVNDAMAVMPSGQVEALVLDSLTYRIRKDLTR